MHDIKGMDMGFSVDDRGSFKAINRQFKNLKFEIAKCVLEDVIKILRESQRCVSSNGIFKARKGYIETIPDIGLFQVEKYFRRYAGDLLPYEPRYYQGEYVYKATFNPHIEARIAEYVGGDFRIEVSAYSKAVDFLYGKLKAECMNAAFGKTEEDLCERFTYTSRCADEDIRYDFFRKAIEYKGARFKVIFEDGIVTSLKI